MKSVKNSTRPTGKTSSSVMHLVLKTLGLLLPIVLMYWIFFIKIPGEVSYAEVWSTITALTGAQNFLLILGGLLTIVTYGWTSATVLPGLSLKRGTQSAVSGQLTSVVLPAPVDLAIRFNMYKSYGFTVDKSAVAVGVAGIARYFTVVAIPLLGLLAMIVSGQGTKSYVLWLLGGGIAFFVALFLMRLILSSKKSARRIGIILQSIVSRVLGLIRRKTDKDIVRIVVDFGARTRDVAVDYFSSIALSNIVWGLSSFVVLLMAIRFCGIDADVMSAPYVLLITGCMLLLNAFPITPGGIGVTETVLITFIVFPTPQTKTAFVSAMFLYRVYTWLLPMPIGALAYLSWRHTSSVGKLSSKNK